MNLLASTKFATNPFDIDLIHNKITNLLGFKDVLNARLVAHSWNSKIIPILKKRAYKIYLDSTNIREYKLILTNSSSSSSSSRLQSSLSILNLNINFGICTTKSQFNKIIDTSIEISRFLTSNIHNNAVIVDSLTFHSVHQNDKKVLDWAKLLHFIQFFSPGLSTLYLFNQEQCFEDFPSHLNLSDNVTFPELKNLSFSWQESTMKLLGSILSNCPNLVNLCIMRRSYELYQDEYYSYCIDVPHKLKILQTHHLHLSELSLAIDMSTSGFLFTTEIQLESIKILKLYILKDVGNNAVTILGNFIKPSFPNLTNLDLYFDAEGITYRLPFNMGELSSLRHFGYHLYNAPPEHDDYSSVKVPTVIKLPESPDFNFPALESVSTTFGIYFQQSSNSLQSLIMKHHEENQNDQEDHVRIVFPKLNSLTLYLQSRIDYNQQNLTIEQYSKQLRTLYPNLKQLIIENQLLVRNDEHQNQNYVYNMIQVILQEMNGIEFILK